MKTHATLLWIREVHQTVNNKERDCDEDILLYDGQILKSQTHENGNQYQEGSNMNLHFAPNR